MLRTHVQLRSEQIINISYYVLRTLSYYDATDRHDAAPRFARGYILRRVKNATPLLSSITKTTVVITCLFTK